MKPACKRGDLPTKAYRAESRGREANTMKRVGLWVVGIGVSRSNFGLRYRNLIPFQEILYWFCRLKTTST